MDIEINTILINNREIDLLSKLYYSEKNINIIQKKIKDIILKKYNYKISKQSYKDLIIIMRNIILSNNKYNYNTKTELKNALNNLNDITIKYCINIIKKNIDNYVIYLNNINKDNILKKTKDNILEKTKDTRTYNLYENNIF